MDTHALTVEESLCGVERKGEGGGNAAHGAWRGSRLSLAVFHSLSPPGSRSCSQDCCGHQQTAVPLHLGSPRRKETVIPREFNVVSSRRRVPPSQEKTAPLAHIILRTHNDVKATAQKLHEKSENDKRRCCFTVWAPIASLSRARSRPVPRVR